MLEDWVPSTLDNGRKHRHGSVIARSHRAVDAHSFTKNAVRSRVQVMRLLRW